MPKATLHKMTVIGRVGKDPELRYTGDGTPVINLSLATTETLPKDKYPEKPEGWKDGYDPTGEGSKNWELTTWIRVTVWRQTAEFVNEYVRKGALVYVEGTLKGKAVNGSQYPSIWQGQNGPRSQFEITATPFTLRVLDYNGNDDEGGSQEDVAEDPFVEGVDESLPF